MVHLPCFRESFKRAFSAAILGDVLNICCILIVLPIELTTGEALLYFIIVSPIRTCIISQTLLIITVIDRIICSKGD